MAATPPSRLPNMLAFAAAMQTAMVAVGVYGVEALHSVRFATARLVAAMALGIIALSLLFFIFPPVAFWRSSLLYATWIALVAMVARPRAAARRAERRALPPPPARARRRARARRGSRR